MGIATLRGLNDSLSQIRNLAMIHGPFTGLNHLLLRRLFLHLKSFVFEIEVLQSLDF